MTNPLAYVEAPVPDDCVFKISPSAFANFVSSPHKWYRSEVLKVDVFEYNTSSVLGTVVHYCAEQVAKGEDVDKKAIEDHVLSLKPKEDYEPQVVLDNYVMMAETLVNDYVLENDYLEVETQHCIEIKNKVYAAGTVDALHGTKEDCMIGDYKTYNSKTAPKTIPAYYKYQLLTYAAILMAKGYNVTRIRLIYVNRNIDGGLSEKTGKPLKSYPPTVTVLTETITNDDLDFIEGLLELCVDTLEASNAHPELNHVIWHDPRLKEAA